MIIEIGCVEKFPFHHLGKIVDAADAVRWAYAVDLLTEKNGSLHITDELSQKELTRMLEDFLDLLS